MVLGANWRLVNAKSSMLVSTHPSYELMIHTLNAYRYVIPDYTTAVVILHSSTTIIILLLSAVVV